MLRARSARKCPSWFDGQLRLADMIAVVVVGQHTLATLGDPFDRTPELARGPECQRIFGVVPALHTEVATDLAGDDAQLGFQDVQDAARHISACGVRALSPDIKREASQPIVPFADAAARLHRSGGDPVEDELEASDMMRLGEGCL